MAVVTNQAGVARGYFGIEDVHQVHKHMIEEMARHGAHVDLLVVLPLSSRGHRGRLRASQRGPKAGAGDGARRPRTRSASISRRPRSSVTARVT